MTIKQQCKELGIKMSTISDRMGYSLSYVCQVINGEKKNPKIISQAMLEIEARKNELRKMIQ